MFSKRSKPKDVAPTPDSDDSRSGLHSSDGTAPILTEKHATSTNRRRPVIIAIVLGCVLILALALGLGLGLGLKDNGSSARPAHKGPNVLVVMTDDQDLLLDSMSVMPNVKSMIGAQGINYEKHYCTVAWCCPSRVNFFTGRAAHNTNVTSIVPPYGGWTKFAEEGLNDNYLPVWMNDAGVDTYYVGKFLNHYGVYNYKTPAHPKAWTESTFLVDPYTYAYYHSHWTNGYTDEITPFTGEHTTYVTQKKALDMLDTAASSDRQFFMMVAPIAPHMETWHGNRAPPIPDGYKGKYNDVKAPRRGNWNPDVPSGASWVYNQSQLTDKNIEFCDNWHYHRIANVAAIDDMVSQLINKLDEHGILDNTYVIYTSDNGFHIGSHRLMPGKRCPYEEDINIPLFIRGPDVAKGVNSTITNSHTDMAPTILQMLGVPTRDDFDGAAIAYTEDSLSSSTKHEMVNVEFWNANGASSVGTTHASYYNNTYKALRFTNGNDSFYYSKWCDGETEFYDMNADYVQMNNRLGPSPKAGVDEYYGRPWKELIARLDAILMVTKSCKQDSCRDPWGVLFPAGQVSDLVVAMRPEYDSFFQNQPKVTFSGCAGGYFPALEGAQEVIAFKS